MTLRRILRVVLALGAVIVWTTMLRPGWLGGSTGYVLVRGVSMEPGYHTGDLVLVRNHGEYRSGDVVAYRVPDGELGSGTLVIHRIVTVSADGFVMQGDNNPRPDDWHPEPGDVIGRAWIRIPRAGLILAHLHAPLPMATLAAAFAVLVVLFPSDDGPPTVAPARRGSSGRAWRGRRLLRRRAAPNESGSTRKSPER